MIASEYRDSLYHDVKLPSGAVFRLKRPSLRFRLEKLASYASVATGLDGQPATTLDVVQLTAAYYDLLEEVCVEPRVSRSPKDGELNVSEIAGEDAQHIARWAGGEVDDVGADLQRFRPGEPADAR